MPQDAFTLRYIVKELGESFVGGKISRINQTGKECLSLLIYTRSGTVKLNIDLSARFCRISAGEEREEANPQNAPNFCMLLRKHLQNAEITAVAQAGFERVVYFDLKCFSEFEITDMRLYLEIMGKYSNAVLTKNGIIVGALKTASLENNARRVILSGAPYRLPERQDKADPTVLDELGKAFEHRSGDLAEFIAANVAGIAYSTAVDVAETLGENATARQLYDYINSDDYSPCLRINDGKICDFAARARGDSIPCGSLLEAQAKFYASAVEKRRFSDRVKRLDSALNSAIKKVEKRLAQSLEKLSECEKADEVKLKGELITANIYAIQRGVTRFEAVNYYDEAGGKIIIELDGALTPSQNAQKYFKRYAKLKRTAENLNAQKAENEARLEYLKTIESNIKRAESEHDLTETEEELIFLSLIPKPPVRKGKRTAEEKAPFRTYLYDGFKILCGRNNIQNDRLTKGLDQDDLWLHAKTFHSTHVAILCGGKEATDGAIKFAAEVCAYYSDGAPKGKVPIDYTLKRFVKKPNKAAPGKVIYTDFKTIIVAPDAHTENLI